MAGRQPPRLRPPLTSPTRYCSDPVMDYLVGLCHGPGLCEDFPLGKMQDPMLPEFACASVAAAALQRPLSFPPGLGAGGYGDSYGGPREQLDGEVRFGPGAQLTS